MVFKKVIKQYPIIPILIISITILIGLLIISTINYFLNPKEQFRVFIDLYSGLISALAIIIALIIPLIMKEMDKKSKVEEKKERENEIFKDVINRIKVYLKYYCDRKEYRDINLNFYSPFIIIMQEKFPELLMKIGIETTKKVDRRTPDSYFDYLEIYIAGKYQIVILPQNIHIYSGKNKALVDQSEDLCKEILTEMKDYAKLRYNLELDNSWFKFP